MDTSAKTAGLAEHWRAECNRSINGTCYSARCMKRGGFVPGNIECATCEEFETAAILDALPTLQAERDDLLAALRESHDAEMTGWSMQGGDARRIRRAWEKARALIARCDERDARGKETE